MEKLVVVKNFLNKYDAELAKRLLISNGIAAVVSADDLGGHRPHLTYGMGGVRLLVREKDLLKANALFDK
ncbi:MAG: DUF2007 domain-containing protein [Candidatus Omnitrophica bacterium]|nr:DUF2007 domain-containing protein [Candidatus Omnitrophota bacterium]MCK5288292.1 DUF2007 domain-containing protein [Candidatus Omnitrophota bacterium]MCK5394203.1 DUF2007 domain-containing protein [Candidatus Omnitrophota bacterium]